MLRSTLKRPAWACCDASAGYSNDDIGRVFDDDDVEDDDDDDAEEVVTASAYEENFLLR